MQVFDYKNFKYEGVTQGFSLCTWKKVMVWDLAQSEYIVNTFVKKPLSIEIVGTVPLSDSPEYIKMKVHTGPFAAVFDVQPHRSSKFCSYGVTSNYYDGLVAIQFNIDIAKIMLELGIGVVRKRKRGIGYNMLKAYDSICNNLTTDQNIEVMPSINAMHLISRCDFVIAMPFTGAALQAKELGKPVVYYDPFTGILNPELYAHGIDYVVGTEALKSWVKCNVKTI
jgi:polysaccharide biosynthesis PFTS motif protein